jgi:7-carboxy-7-deazaguanine synthase
MSVQQIVHQVTHEHSADHVVITGGEPMLPAEMAQLCEALSQAGKHITIETAGTIFKPVTCDLMSISPKLSNSKPAESRAGDWARRHDQTRFRPEVTQQLMDRHAYQLKFVVDRPEDIDEIIDYVGHLNDCDPDRILLMPEGVDSEILASKEQWLGPICDRHGFKLCRRMHIQWYGNTRGT